MTDPARQGGTARGPLLCHSGDASREAIERALEVLRHGWSFLRAWDGLSPEVLELLVAQARLSALMAFMAAEAADTTAHELLETLAENQLQRGERQDSLSGWH